MIKRTPVTFLLLWIILLIGAALRLYNFGSLPFMHDELSAFFRLKQDSLIDLIAKGVKEDGHPAGTQVLMYYWTWLFGLSPWVIKLPFFLFSLACVWLIYKIGSRWFSSQAGLLAAAYMATLQFAIMYGQLARPYSMGLFFSLLAVFYWTNFLVNERVKPAQLAGYVIAIALCAYTHYFSLFFVFVLGFTGLFFVPRNRMTPYLLGNALAVILFMPHLFITFYQVGSLQGLEWMGPPRDDFIIEFFRYLFHYSAGTFITTLVIALVGLVSKPALNKEKNRLRLVCLIWFAVPAATGIAYSCYVKPVMQFSSLLFSFPFILLLLFSFVDKLKPYLLTLLVTIVLFVNSFSLIKNREHYKMLYHQPFSEFAVLTKAFASTHGTNVSLFFGENPRLVNYYFNKTLTGLNYHSIFDKNIKPVEFRKKLDSLQTKYLILANVPLEWHAVAREFYPYTILYSKGFTYEFYCFSKEKNDPVLSSEVEFEQEIDWNTPGMMWQFNRQKVRRDSQEKTTALYTMEQDDEWGPAFEYRIDSMAYSRHQWLQAAISVNLQEQGAGGELAFQITRDGKELDWRSAKVSEFADTTKLNAWQDVYLTFRMATVFKHHPEMKDATLKVFFWNTQKKNIHLKNFRVSVLKGNNYVYGLYEDIH